MIVLLFHACNIFKPEIYNGALIFVSLFNVVNPSILNDDKNKELCLTNTLFKFDYSLAFRFEYIVAISDVGQCFVNKLKIKRKNPF